MSLAEYDQHSKTQRCEQCKSLLRRVFTPCVLRTTTQFMSGSSDGLPDDASRRIAYAKASAAGVSVAGKKFHPGLCPKGESYSPKAWYGDAEEVKRKAVALGRSVEGAINVTGPTFDSDLAALERPYRVSRRVVADDVNMEIMAAHGGKVSRAKREELFRKYQDKHSGNQKRPGKVALGPK